MELFVIEEGLEGVLFIDVLKHLVEDDVEFELAFEMGGQQLVFALYVNDEFSEWLIINPEIVNNEQNTIEHVLVVVLLIYVLLVLLLLYYYYSVIGVYVTFEPNVSPELLYLLLVL